MGYANLSNDGHRVKQPGIKDYLNLSKDLLHILFYSLFILLRKFAMMFVQASPKSLEGHIVLVTGGANGIGREICRQLALQERNLTIITWDVNEEENLETVKDLQSLGVKQAHAFTVDVSQREQVEAAAKKVVARLAKWLIREEIGDVTILFNNAGVAGEISAGWTQNPKTIEKVFGVNALSHCWTLREFLPKMIEKGEGNIVQTCSVLGWAYGATGSAYVGSKFAVRGYTECIKEDLRRFHPRSNICISLVYPHHVQTNMTANVDFMSSKYDFLVKLNMTPSYVAKEIVSGMRNNKEHIFVPASGWVLRFMSLISPDILRKAFDILSDPPPPVLKQNGNMAAQKVRQ